MEKEQRPCDYHQAFMYGSPFLLHRRNILSQQIDYELSNYPDENKTATVKNKTSSRKVTVIQGCEEKNRSSPGMNSCQHYHKFLETFPGKPLKPLVECAVEPSCQKKRCVYDKKSEVYPSKSFHPSVHFHTSKNKNNDIQIRYQF